jgi:sporulation integral membrane protein YlbJ
MANLLIMVAVIYLIYYMFRWIIRNLFFINIYMSSILISTCVLLFILTIVFNPKQSFDAALKGINLCINVVFPSLFPFFVGTELLTNLGLVHILKFFFEPVMRPIFNVPGSGSFAFAMGIISGYPVGAKITVDLRQKGLCTKAEGERLLTFCNNSGPLFILGAVAVGMFNQPSAGIILFISHFIASLTVGLCFRFYKPNKTREESYQVKQSSKQSLTEILKQIKKFREKDGRNFGELFGDTIKNAVNLLLTIGGFIVFFSVLINLLDYLKVIAFFAELLSIFLVPLGIAQELLPSIISGFFEITTGIKIASTHSTIPLIQRLMVTSLILGWAGLSVHCQVFGIVGKSDISVLPYLLGKGLQGIFSAIYTFLLLTFTPLITTVSATLNVPSENLINLNIVNSFCSSLIYFGNILLFLIVICIVMVSTTIFKKN